MLTAVPALRLTKLTRAGAKQLTAIGLLLALLEYHSCEQQAQHQKVVINLPWWLQFVIIFALFLPIPYSSLSVIRFHVQQANERQSLTEGKCTRAQTHKKRNHTYPAAKPAMCFLDSILRDITGKLAPETKMKGYFLSNAQRSNHLIAMHPCNQYQ